MLDSGQANGARCSLYGHKWAKKNAKYLKDVCWDRQRLVQIIHNIDSSDPEKCLKDVRKAQGFLHDTGNYPYRQYKDPLDINE